MCEMNAGCRKYQLAATTGANWGENHQWVLNLLGGSLTGNGVTAWFQCRKDKTQRKPVSFSLENLLRTTYIKLIKVSITSHGQIPFSTWRERTFVWVLLWMHNLNLLTECQTMERLVQNGLDASKMVRWWEIMTKELFLTKGTMTTGCNSSSGLDPNPGSI